MTPFDPDAFLAENSVSDFDPDAFLAENSASTQPKSTLLDKFHSALEAGGIYQSFSNSVISGDAKGLHRKDDGNWDLPIMSKNDGSIVDSIGNFAVSIGQDLGSRLDSAGPAVNKDEIQNIFHDFQQANNLSDEKMGKIWNDASKDVLTPKGAPPESPLRTLSTEFDMKIAPAIGTMLSAIGLGSAAAAFASPTGPGAVVAGVSGSVAGGIAGGVATDKAQTVILDTINGFGWTHRNAKQIREQMAVNAKYNPKSAAIGNMIPFLISILGGGGKEVVAKEIVGSARAASSATAIGENVPKTINVKLGDAITAQGARALKSTWEWNKGAFQEGIRRRAAGVAEDALTPAMKAAETQRGNVEPMLERFAQMAAKGARGSGSEAAQRKWVEGEKNADGSEISIIDQAARGAVTFAATGVLPPAKILGAVGLYPAMKEILSQSVARGVGDAAAMTAAGETYDAITTGKAPSWEKTVKEMGGSVPAFVIQNIVMSAFGRTMGASGGKTGKEATTEAGSTTKNGKQKPRPYNPFEPSSPKPDSPAPRGSVFDIQVEAMDAVKPVRAAGMNQTADELQKQSGSFTSSGPDVTTGAGVAETIFGLATKGKMYRENLNPADFTLGKVGKDGTQPVLYENGVTDRVFNPSTGQFSTVAVKGAFVGLPLFLKNKPKEETAASTLPSVDTAAPAAPVGGEKLDQVEGSGSNSIIPGVTQTEADAATLKATTTAHLDSLPTGNSFAWVPKSMNPERLPSSATKMPDGQWEVKHGNDPAITYPSVDAAGFFNASQSETSAPAASTQVKAPAVAASPPAQTEAAASVDPASMIRKISDGHYEWNTPNGGKGNLKLSPKNDTEAYAHALRVTTAAISSPNEEETSSEKAVPKAQGQGNALEPAPDAPVASVAAEAVAASTQTERESIQEEIKSLEKELAEAVGSRYNVSQADIRLIKAEIAEKKSDLAKLNSPPLASSPGSPATSTQSSLRFPESQLAKHLTQDSKTKAESIDSGDVNAAVVPGDSAPIGSRLAQGTLIESTGADGSVVAQRVVTHTTRLPNGHVKHHLQLVTNPEETAAAYAPHPLVTQASVAAVADSSLTSVEAAIRAQFDQMASPEFTASVVDFSDNGDLMTASIAPDGKETISVNTPAIKAMLDTALSSSDQANPVAMQFLAADFSEMLATVATEENIHIVAGKEFSRHEEGGRDLIDNMHVELELATDPDAPAELTESFFDNARHRLAATVAFGGGELAKMSDDQIALLLRGESVNFNGQDHQISREQLGDELWAMGQEKIANLILASMGGADVHKAQEAFQRQAAAFGGKGKNATKAQSWAKRLFEMANRALAAVQRYLRALRLIKQLSPAMERKYYRVVELMKNGGFRFDMISNPEAVAKGASAEYRPFNTPDVHGVRERFLRQADDTMDQLGAIANERWSDRAVQKQLATVIQRIQTKLGDSKFKPVTIDPFMRLVPHKRLDKAFKDELAPLLKALNDPQRTETFLAVSAIAADMRLVLDHANGGRPVTTTSKILDSFDPLRSQDLIPTIRVSLERSLEKASGVKLASFLESVNQALNTLRNSDSGVLMPKFESLSSYFIDGAGKDDLTMNELALKADAMNFPGADPEIQAEHNQAFQDAIEDLKGSSPAMAIELGGIEARNAIAKQEAIKAIALRQRSGAIVRGISDLASRWIADDSGVREAVHLAKFDSVSVGSSLVDAQAAFRAVSQISGIEEKMEYLVAGGPRPVSMRERMPDRWVNMNVPSISDGLSLAPINLGRISRPLGDNVPEMARNAVRRTLEPSTTASLTLNELSAKTDDLELKKVLDDGEMRLFLEGRGGEQARVVEGKVVPGRACA